MRDLHAQIVRGGPGASLQLARCPTRSLCSLRPLPVQRLLGDIRAGQVDVVVVYKIDRLTRSLFDFAKIVEAFDARGVSFVSITQQFNTTTRWGGLP